MNSFFKITNKQVVTLCVILAGVFMAGGMVTWWNSVSRGDFFVFVKQGYWFYTVLFPSLLFLLFVPVLWLAYKTSAGKIAKGLAWAALAFAIASVGLRIYATHLEPYNLQVVEHEIVSSKITVPITIVQMADIQSAGIGDYEARVFETVRGLEPDLILNTGDNLQPTPPNTLQTEHPKLQALFETLNPPMGIYCIYGNVEDDILYRMPEGTMGMTLLRNSARKILIGGSTIHLYGLDWPESENGSNRILRWFQQTDPDEFTIVMGHSPDYIRSCSDLPIDLCLAGHVHGGQIVVPFYGPLVTFSALPKHLVSGLNPIVNTRLNVSKGIGAEHHIGLPSIRLFCPPDITVFRLLPEHHPSVTTAE
jgi:predicted MPP superfamily phosphohydrolase